MHLGASVTFWAFKVDAATEDINQTFRIHAIVVTAFRLTTDNVVSSLFHICMSPTLPFHAKDASLISSSRQYGRNRWIVWLLVLCGISIPGLLLSYHQESSNLVRSYWSTLHDKIEDIWDGSSTEAHHLEDPYGLDEDFDHLPTTPDALEEHVIENGTTCPRSGKRWVLDPTLASQTPPDYSDYWKFKHAFPWEHTHHLNGVWTHYRSGAYAAIKQRTAIPMHCPTDKDIMYRFFVHNRNWTEYQRLWNMQSYRLESCDGEEMVKFDAEAFVRHLIKSGPMLIAGDSVSLQHFVTLACALGEHLETTSTNRTDAWNIDLELYGLIPNDYYMVPAGMRLRSTSPLYAEFPDHREELVVYMRDNHLANNVDFKLDPYEQIDYPDIRYRPMRESIMRSLRLSLDVATKDTHRQVSRPDNMDADTEALFAKYEIPPIRKFGTIELNAGPHWIMRKLHRSRAEVAKAYQEMIDDFISLFASSPALTTRADAKIIIRTTPPGNLNCESRKIPAHGIDLVNKVIRDGPKSYINLTGTVEDYTVEDYDGVERIATGDQRDLFNRMWKVSLARLHAEHPMTKKTVMLMDISDISFYRPDAHSLLVPLKTTIDCMHYAMLGGVLEGK